jgi:hypothetical protein
MYAKYVMVHMQKYISKLRFKPHMLLASCLLPILTQTSFAQTSKFSLELELGSSWQAKNDVQIPNDLDGSRFSAKDIVGNGPWSNVRLNGLYNFNDKHALRVVLAPFSYSETGVSNIPIQYQNQAFQANQPLQTDYKFNLWRVGYRYHFYERENHDMWFGVTSKIRDAEVSLRQQNVKGTDDNVGFVPLLYFATEYRLNNSWSVFADIDGLAGGPGRAFDLSVKLNYDLNSDWKLGIGYRTLEGGVDNDDVYNFAGFNSALISLSRKF